MTYKKLIKVLGNGLLLVPFVLMVDAFQTAWFNPSHSVLVYINLYNEAYFDLICLGVIALFGAWGLVLNIIDWTNEKKI